MVGAVFLALGIIGRKKQRDEQSPGGVDVALREGVTDGKINV